MSLKLNRVPRRVLDCALGHQLQHALAGENVSTTDVMTDYKEFNKILAEKVMDCGRSPERVQRAKDFFNMVAEEARTLDI